MGIQIRFWSATKVGDGSPQEFWLGSQPPTAEPGETLWIVESGHTIAPLSGTSFAELWAWRANEIRYVRSLGVMDG